MLNIQGRVIPCPGWKSAWGLPAEDSTILANVIFSIQRMLEKK